MPGTHENQIPPDLSVAAHRVYWLKKLSGRVPDTDWFMHNGNSGVGGDKHRRYSFELPELQCQALFRTSRGSDLSLYVILVAVLKLLRYKYSGDNDIIVLSPVYQPEETNVAADLVPLRTSINGGATFKELLSAVKQTTLEAYSNQGLSLAEITSLFALPTAGELRAISNVVILLESIHDRSVITKKPVDLTFSFAASGGRLVCEMTYAPHLFSENEAERIGSQYVTALRSALERGDVKLAETRILTPRDLQVLDNLNQNEGFCPSELAIAELFEHQAAATPDRVAAVFEDCSITYSQLNNVANRVAASLRGFGVGPESVVALLGQRDIDYLATILGAYKAGGAYLPLDPAHPVERLGQILASSAACVVVIATRYREKLDRVFRAITLEKPPTVIVFEDIARERAPNILAAQICGTSLSYVFYTSGSAGVPKGAMVELAGMRNHLFAKIQDLALAPEDVVAQNASQCFDISIWQFLAALLIGGTVQIISDETARDVEALLKEIAMRGVTILEVVPSQLRAMLEGLALNDSSDMDLPALRCLVSTGEALPPEICRKWLARYRHKPIVNAWGPTETSDDVTHFHITELSDDAISVPIGRTLPNTSAYFLDRDLARTPLGVPGEIHVGGICVGRGYLGDPLRTAAAFIPDPFSRMPGSRLYATGDLGYCNTESNIIFLGRIDYQVKVRGYRIELQEIEAALARHADIRESVVLAREDQPGKKRLVAYIAMSPGASCSMSELNTFLKDRLPDYMVPSAIVVLQSLPRMSSGKLDRNNLPPPDSAREELERSFVPATSYVEEVLAESWSQVLGVTKVGVNDNFFDLGGDSILCIQVVAKVRQAGLQISPNQIFQFQTIRELAQVVRTLQAPAASQEPVTGPVPLTPIQHWFFDLQFPNPNFHNQALTLEVRERLDPSLVRKAMASLLHHHDGLRLRFSKNQDHWEQTNSAPNENVPFSVVDLSGKQAMEQERCAREIAADLHASIDLEKGPIFNSALFDLGTGQPQVLLLIAHHVAVDGVSWRILHEDLQAAYKQLVEGKRVVLPAKTTSCKEWAERLNEYAQSSQLEREVPYWSETVKACPGRLPVDFPGGDNSIASTQTVSVELSPEDTRALLRSLSAVYNAQINEVLLVALYQAVSAWSGLARFHVDLEGHGRLETFEGMDLSRTVGWFTAIYPVLLQGSADWTPDRMLKAVMEQIRRIPRNGTGFGPLRYLNQNPEIAAAFKQVPRPEISFNYLGQFDRAEPDSEIFRWKSLSLVSDHNRSRHYLLDINGLISSGRLQFNFACSQNLYKQATIESLAHEFLCSLREFIANSRRLGEEQGRTPAFPDANLSDRQLAEVMALLD